jgi:hypothetical protein
VQQPRPSRTRRRDPRARLAAQLEDLIKDTGTLTAADRGEARGLPGRQARPEAAPAPQPPVYHRREDRIRAHVILCWLALLLIRVIENSAGRPWATIRAELQRQPAVTWTGLAGTFRQTTDLTKPQGDIGIYTALSIEPPKKIITLTLAPLAL